MASGPATVALTALLLFGCSREAEPSPEPLARKTDPEPEAEAPREAVGQGAPPAKTAAGTLHPAAPLASVTAAELLERVRASGKKGVLINVWATFCGPCKRELPVVQKLVPGLRAQGLEVVLVSADVEEDRDKAAAFLREHGIALPSYLAARPLGVFKQTLNPRWPGMVPASFLFDGTATLRYYWGGEAFEEELTPVLEAFAAGEPIHGEADFIVAPGSASAR